MAESLLIYGIGRASIMPTSIPGRSLALFVYLLVLDGAATYFFTRGFLLTRNEVPLFSNCSDISQFEVCSKRPSLSQRFTTVFPEVPTMERVNASIGAEDVLKQEKEARAHQCWTRPAIKKAIVIIIDALRFDFVAHSRNFNGEEKPWMNKLKVLQRLLDEDNSTARLFKFIADPPTTTLQRLKGLTTGGLPTFIDIGESFGAPAIAEDNLLLQLGGTGKRVIMMGDDTWTNLFPTAFTEAYPFPSFNVKDLHTVDDGVIQELFPALGRDNWDVLIAHFLGVDHVGHIFGVESPLMVEKLDQYNEVIEDVIKLLRNTTEPGGLFEDTLLIVMGDHGQTLNGDHGGGTPEEVETAFFAYGTRTHQSPCSLHLDGHSAPCDLEDPVNGCISTFFQLDFSATMAALLGVPFPFGSVGLVNADLFSMVAGNVIDFPGNSSEEEPHWHTLKLLEQLRDVLCVNSWQVRRYFEAYAKLSMSGFRPRDLVQLENLYNSTQSVSEIDQESIFNVGITADTQGRDLSILRAIAAVREEVQSYMQYLSAAASLARSKWTQFGMEWMVLGFLLLVASVVVRALALLRLCGHGLKHSEKLFPTKMMLAGVLGSGCLLVIAVSIHWLLARKSFQWMLTYVIDNIGMVFLGVMVVASVIIYIVVSTGLSPERTPETSNAKQVLEVQTDGSNFQLDASVICTTVLLALQAFGVFSNSYIVAEGMLIHFLLTSSGLLVLRSAFESKVKVFQALCFLVLICLMPRIHTLGIFKGSSVQEMPLNLVVSDSSISLQLSTIGFTSITVVLPLTILSWLANRITGRHPLCRRIILGTTITYSFIGLHWLIVDLTSIQHKSITDSLVDFNRLHIPRLIYGMSVILTCTSALLGKFWIKGIDAKNCNYKEVLAAVTIALVFSPSGTIILLLRRMGPWVTLLTVLEVWLFLELQRFTPSVQNMKTNSNKLERSTYSRLSFGRIHDWTLIATQIFFSTGHRCSFDGLHFSAAFIGFDDFSFLQQGVLISIETFGASHVLPLIVLPLLALRNSGSTHPVGQLSDTTRIVVELTKGYLWFGFFRGFVMSATAASVCIQRRHLMVWGIFAPKYAFDMVGFLLGDVSIVLAMALYLSFLPNKVHKA